MSSLSDSDIAALHEALDDEYKAWATYDQVIEDFGLVRPFSNIRESESRHIDALLQIFSDFGLNPPETTWVGRSPRFDSIAAACAAAVQGEIENVELYERIIAGAKCPDLLAVFRNLHEASQQRHLPAFRRCLNRHRSRDY